MGLLRHCVPRKDGGSKTNFTCVTKCPPSGGQGGLWFKAIASSLCPRNDEILSDIL